MSNLLRNKFKSWLDRRIPPAAEVTLSQRSIFIMPSKTGGMFLLLLILLLITAINYQNSLIYGLVFWLFSIGLSAMIFTYRNLSGLTLKAGNAVVGFAGNTIEIPIRLADPKRSHYGLSLSWAQNNADNEDTGSAGNLGSDLPEASVSCDLVVDNKHTNSSTGSNETEVKIPFSLNTRGHLKTPRLKLQTRYPFGLYTCWTWVRLKSPGIVYPKPITTPFITAEGHGDDLQADANLALGNDEFIGLRSYQAGDSLKHIAWKYLAKGKGLLTKEYDNQQLSMQWLDWHSLQGMAEENRLSHLTGWILQAEQQGRAYGLRLVGQTIAPSQGDGHRKQCLAALALYNLDLANPSEQVNQ